MNEKSRALPQGDEECVRQCREGSIDAFRVLVERYEKKMLNIAYRMIDDYDEACEVVQEAFLSAFQAIKKFRGDAAFSTWLTSITINHAKNRMKQVRSRAHHEVASIDDSMQTDPGNTAGYDVPGTDPPALELMERKEVQVKVQGCINALDGEYREVLVLRDIEEFSYDEIGGILKIAEGTVKSRLFRARKAVRDCLKKELGDL